MIRPCECLTREFSASRSANRLAIAVLASAIPLVSANAESGDRIGDAVAIQNTVFADYAKSQRTLAVGDDVRQDEAIEVTLDARGEFKLDDDTKLALGPGARLVLDKFVYDSDKKAGSIVLDMTKGAFRFITGIATKPTYVIKTPNASITVRGTVFDTFILPDETVWLLLHSGGLEVTGRKSACRVLDQPGRLVRISKDGVVGPSVDWSKLEGADSSIFDTAFPFVEKPPQIDPTPVLTRAAVINGALTDAPDKDCVNAKPPIKVQKADLGPDGGDGPSKPKKKTTKRSGGDDNVRVVVPTGKVKRVKKDDDQPKRTKTAKRPKPSSDDDEAAAAAASVIIGIGIGSIGRGGRGGMKGHNRTPN
ncbi:MAG: FecR domain-containing protein [Hyphomicrobium sp.]